MLLKAFASPRHFRSWLETNHARVNELDRRMLAAFEARETKAKRRYSFESKPEKLGSSAEKKFGANREAWGLTSISFQHERIAHEDSPTSHLGRLAPDRDGFRFPPGVGPNRHPAARS